MPHGLYIAASYVLHLCYSYTRHFSIDFKFLMLSGRSSSLLVLDCEPHHCLTARCLRFTRKEHNGKINVTKMKNVKDILRPCTKSQKTCTSSDVYDWVSEVKKFKDKKTKQKRNRSVVCWRVYCLSFPIKEPCHVKSTSLFALFVIQKAQLTLSFSLAVALRLPANRYL